MAMFFNMTPSHFQTKSKKEFFIFRSALFRNIGSETLEKPHFEKSQLGPLSMKLLDVNKKDVFLFTLCNI